MRRSRTGTMREIKVVDDWRASRWSIDGTTLLIGPETSGRFSPEVLGHEIAHLQLGHIGKPPANALDNFYRELSTWDYALGKAPKGSWDRKVVKETLQINLDFLKEVLREQEVLGPYGIEYKDLRKAQTAVRTLLRKHEKKFFEGEEK